VSLLFAGGFLLGQDQPAKQQDPVVPDLAQLLAKPHSELHAVVRRFDADRGNLLRFYSIPSSPTRHARMKRFHTDWSAALAKLDAAKFSALGRADYVELQKKINSELDQLDADVKAQAQITTLLPFAQAVIALEESRQQMDKMDAAKVAGVLNKVNKQIRRSNQKLAAAAKAGNQDGDFKVSKEFAERAAATTGELRSALKRWFSFYNAYDPIFTWWMADVYKEVDQALEDYEILLRDKGPGVTLPLEVAAPAPQPLIVDASNPRFAFPGKESDAPNLEELIAQRVSELRDVLLRYQGDRFKVSKWVGVGKGPKTPEAKDRLKKFSADWLAAVAKLDFDKLSQEGKVDYLLLKNHLQRELRRLDLPAREDAGKKDASGITGFPIGREALLSELAGEMIAYTPEELLAIADQEFAWCRAEMKKATRDLGFDEAEWLKAIEKVKTLHVEPGKQPQVIRDLAWEAIAYLQKHDLVTVPPIAQETWRMEMMSPQRQLVNPFFTGGEVISVSFPTNTMAYEAKLQSLRGNNVHFSRATVHHELIPGHHLQLFMKARYNTHRQPLGTPFWIEGWALYWELRLYDRGFAKSPEDKVGFLFWRMHRCARIHFSLNYHLGKWTPQECINYLVERVGHEPANAAAEVRRSFAGGYGPLYQAAYLLGGLQFRALHKELVPTGKMTERAFHDAILQANGMPVEMVRALLTEQKLTRDFSPQWKFY
jgi:uncharacterized protein (DUF885 family)